MENRFTYDIFTDVNSILEMLDNFPNACESTPYQNIEYVKLALRMHRLYSFVRFVRPFFIRFNINGLPALIMPLSKSIFRSRYCLFGDRAGFGYLDMIRRADLTSSDMKACFNLLTKDFARSDFYFNRVREDSLTYEVLNQIAISGDYEECVKVELNTDFRHYFNALTKNSKQNFRTANNRIAKSGKEILFHRVNGRNVSKSVINEVIRLYLKRIKIHGKRIGFVDRIFYKNFDLGFASISRLNFTEICLLYIGNELAAFMICLIDGDKLLVPRLAIDESYSFFSPGVLLVISAVNDLQSNEKKIKTIDLMQGKEPYKFQVGGQIHRCHSFKLIKETEYLG